MPCRIHFSLPEELFKHPETGAKFPFRTGERVWVPNGGPNRKGCYIEIGENSVLEAYKNPAQFKLDVKPIGWIQKLNSKVYYGVTGHVEETFHNVKKKSEKTGSEYHERERCMGRGCKLCQEKWEKVFGKKVYFEIARTHWNESIFSANEQISSNCKCGGFIYTPHYECEKCEHQLVDMMNFCFNCESQNIELDTEEAKAVCVDCKAEWSVFESDNEEISKVVSEDMKCPNCQHEALPKPVMVCTECEDPNPYGIFDCQLKIKMVGSKDGKSKDLVIDDIRIQEPDEKLFDPQFQGEDKEWSQKIADGMKKPIDLHRQMAPPTQDEEAALLNVPNPFTGGAGESKGFKTYSRHESEGEEEPESSSEDEVERQPPKGPSIAKGAKRPAGRPHVGIRK